MKKTIWCLFSITNDYDQPSDNLVAWWTNKPSLAQLTAALVEDGAAPEEALVLEVLDGQDTPVNSNGVKHGGTTYRIESVPEHS